MKDPRHELLYPELSDVVRQLRGGADPDAAWAIASAAFAAAREDDDIELFLAIDDRDLDSLSEIVQGWITGTRDLTRHDRELLKRALKAFRKRLRVVRLDSESSVGGGPLSGGQKSHIVGVRAPEDYPQEVWDRLVMQKRLVDARDGVYELPPE